MLPTNRRPVFKCLEMLQQGVVDGVDIRLVVLLRVFPCLLGTLQQQVDDVGSQLASTFWTRTSMALASLASHCL